MSRAALLAPVDIVVVSHSGAPLLSALECAVAARLCTGQVQPIQLLATSI